jgi:hypothetical protein
MDIMVHIPDDLARRLGTAGELERRALEALAAEGYRRGHLTEAQVRRLLGYADALLDDFFKAHDVSVPAREAAPAIDEESRVRARRAADNILARRKGVTLGGLSIKDLINEGRP